MLCISTLIWKWLTLSFPRIQYLRRFSFHASYGDSSGLVVTLFPSLLISTQRILNLIPWLIWDPYGVSLLEIRNWWAAFPTVPSGAPYLRLHLYSNMQYERHEQLWTLHYGVFQKLSLWEAQTVWEQTDRGFFQNFWLHRPYSKWCRISIASWIDVKFWSHDIISFVSL